MVKALDEQIRGLRRQPPGSIAPSPAAIAGALAIVQGFDGHLPLVEVTLTAGVALEWRDYIEARLEVASNGMVSVLLRLRGGHRISAGLG